MPEIQTDSALLRLRKRAAQTTQEAQEQCELCSAPIPHEHRHLLKIATREMSCVCYACSILFDSPAASDGKQRLIPDRRRFLEDFEMSDAQWENLRIPVGMAFFFASTLAERVCVFYPSPAGSIESLMTRETWQEIKARNPILDTMQSDVEALLVNRARGARQYFLVPIDECYRLVALIRLRWKGLSGGSEVWKEMDEFFAALRNNCRA